MPDLDLAERLPDAFPSYDDETDFAAWLRAHQDEVDALDADLDDVQRSLQVAHATGDELDRIGADFGIIGRRRGRDDDSYRQFLQSLVRAYSGRGTPPGLKTAVATGVLATEADVGLVEDFVANRYEVELYDWEAHKTGTVHTLANLADPSVVQRRDPLHYYLGTAVANLLAGETEVAEMTTTETAIVQLLAGETEIAEMLTSPTASLRLNPSASTSTTTSSAGLSASELDPLSQGGTWNLSDTQ